MILKILRWLKGYIVFSASGKFPERFINLMNVNGVRYWDSQPCPGGFSATMLLCDYLNIRSLARKSKVRLKIRKKKGLPFLIVKYKKRKGLLIGAVCAVLLVAILSRFVWVVDVQGTERLSEQQLKPILKEYGLEVGAIKNSVDIEKVERYTLLETPEIRWISVNLLNNIATVEIKEKTPKPSINKKYPCNIKASCDGVVTKASVLNGTNQVKVGSAVTKNQLLVNSVMTQGENSVKYVHSQAEIFADVRYEKVFKQDKNEMYFVPKENFTEKTTCNFLWINFPGNISSSLKGANASIFKNYKLFINNVDLPIGYTKEVNYYYNTETKSRNEKKILKNKLALYEIFNENDSQIKERKVRFSEKKDSIVMSVSYTVNKNIARKQKIKVKS